MNYTKLSKYAKSDINRVLTYLRSTGQSVGKLPQAIDTNSPIIEKHLSAVLMDGTYDQADAYTKRAVGWLMLYCDNLRAGNASGYARDRSAEASSEANSNPGRQSVVSRVSLPDDLVTAWEAMTPQERGDWIAERWEAQ